MALAMKKPYGYSKMEKEDPEEMKHRRAQFLIYKVMEQADRKPRSSSSWSLRMIRISKLKVKIGKRLRRFRKKILSSVSYSAAKSGFHGNLLVHLKIWRNIINLPPLFK